MMLTLLVEAALRSLALGGTVWLGLTLLRVRDPRAHMTAWTSVLVASLAMPLIMNSLTLTLPSATPLLRLPEIVALPPASPLDVAATAEGIVQADGAPAAAAHGPGPAPGPTPATPGWRVDRWVNWPVLATGIYLLVAAVLLARLLIGIVLTWRLTRSARPVDGADANVRVCDVVGVPVTFASIILLPPECAEWSAAKRQAVLSHERSHVARGDCYVLLLAALNRAVFWFSPFAWWQFARLAELAEMISDDAAIEAVADRRSYADVLLDLAGNARAAPASLAMARAATVGRRVERILAATAPPLRTGWRKQLTVALAIAPVVAIAAGSIARNAPHTDPAAAAVDQPFEVDVPAAAGKSFMNASVDPRLLDAYTGYYRLSPASFVAITREDDHLFAQLTGERKLPIFALNDRQFLYKAAARITFTAGEPSSPELILHLNGADARATRIADVAGKERPAVAVAEHVLSSYVGWYELAPTRAVAVTREGDRLFAQVTGRAKFQAIPRGEKNFASADSNASIVFMSEGRDVGTTTLLFHNPTLGARAGKRIDAAKAAEIQDVLAHWVAAARDRFRDQTPAPGSKDAIVQAIADLGRGVAPDESSWQLPDAVRRNASDLHAMLSALGTPQSIVFRGVGPGGYDIYGAKFANGFAEFRLLMRPDGRIDDMIFRPDGDDTPGRLAACVEEPTLASTSGTVPIKWVLFNGHGGDIRLFELDAAGRRVPYGTIGDDRSAAIQTSVGRAWVVTDVAGQCLNIVLPGHRARFLNVQPARAGEPQPGARRSMPMPGSEDALRDYIETLTRGDPDYRRMTAEVAAYTRQQLLLNQAILAKLGELRAVSFRGVSPLDNDVYMVHFANGSAEWRIGLVKGDRIGRIALGPHY